MTSLTERLAARGNDTAGALARFLGDEALYGDCFRMFLNDPCFLQLEDAPTAFDAAHTLKGVAGNLGLTALYGALSALTEPLRRGQTEDLVSLRQAVQAERESLVRLLNG